MMRRRFESLVVLVGVVLLSSCGLISGGQTVEFVIHVDSITGPTAVSGGAAFEQQVWGFVGPDGCYSFTEFQLDRVPTRLDLTAKGTHHTGSGLCTEAVIFLRGQTVRIDPPIPGGLFTIAIHQPDGTLLTRIIHSE